MPQRTVLQPRIGRVEPRPRSEARPRARAERPARAGVRPLVTVWAAWIVLMAGVNAATPLYSVYAQRFGFSSLVLTAVFAAYAVVLIPALLLFGRLSDRFGRRPVILAGLVVACVGLAVFAAAQNVAWLVGARVLQGLAVGMISGPATAALVELDPHPAGKRPALLAGLAQAGGSALGPLAAGVLATWAPAPRQLSYLVALAAAVAAAVFVWTLTEPDLGEREPWRIQRPRVPAEIRGDFVRVSLSAAVVWASVALCLSIVPSYASDLLGSRNLALLGAIAAVALGASCVALVVMQRVQLAVQRAQAIGLTVLAVGLVGIAVAAPLHSLVVLLAGAAATGAGHGLGFLNSQDELNAVAPDERRGEVTAAFISCIYLAVATSVIASGLVDEWLSLSVSVGVVALVLAALALAAAAWQARGAGGDA
jgi:predicted MFS family arabinose efflux permease